VLSFEVALADGSIVQANINSHPDLYKALRGGGANFGVVTNLDLKVYLYEGMWGGGVSWAWEHGDALIDAFLEYGRDNLRNQVIFGVIAHEGQWVWYCDLEHLKPTPPEPDSVLKRFLDIPTLLNETGPTSQLQRTDGINDHYPPGSYNGYWTFCTQVDKRIIRFFMDTWRTKVTPLLDIEGLDRSALADINFVPRSVVDAMKRNGGNALGIASKEPFLLFLMELYWMKAEDGPRVWNAQRVTAEKTQGLARELGLHHEYIYLNYANLYQDVYSGYGDEAKRFLKAVSAKYDPSGMFQHQRGAGWYLKGPIKSLSPP
jgi:hypothetical protein